MTLEEMIELGNLFRRLAAMDGAAFAETVTTCRVDQLPALSEEDLKLISQLASKLSRSNLGSLEVFGEISGLVNLNQEPVLKIEGEPVTVRLVKIVEHGNAYFVTLSGFEGSLKDSQFMSEAKRISIADNFSLFATQMCIYAPWGTTTGITASLAAFDSPRRLVRDQTQQLTPDDIAPWYLTHSAAETSPIFSAWKEQASRKLAFSIPTEIRTTDDGFQVILKGARSAFAGVDTSQPLSSAFGQLMEAIRWVYDQRRDTETKFHLLNNHLALYWPDDAKWPVGLAEVLEHALASAREAFAFHLQEDSKEAIKSLGDLRKALQDEVARSQVATRDLLSALWRDAAIAGAAFALRSATANVAVVNLIATSAAILLSISLVTTLLSNWRFDVLAKAVREQWRTRLYAFMSATQWSTLVLEPISKARWVYRLSIVPVSTVYIALILALLWMPFPARIEALGTYVWELTCELSKPLFDLMQIPPTPATVPHSP